MTGRENDDRRRSGADREVTATQVGGASVDRLLWNILRPQKCGFSVRRGSARSTQSAFDKAVSGW
jgi:hypothetical protein